MSKLINGTDEVNDLLRTHSRIVPNIRMAPFIEQLAAVNEWRISRSNVISIIRTHKQMFHNQKRYETAPLRYNYTTKKKTKKKDKGKENRFEKMTTVKRPQTRSHLFYCLEKRFTTWHLFCLSFSSLVIRVGLTLTWNIRQVSLPHKIYKDGKRWKTHHHN